MLDDNHLLQRAASSAYASMAALTVAANMYNSFYPTASTSSDPVNYFPCSDNKRERLDAKIRVKLEDSDLWTRFFSLGNEMIITKNGRRLFPNFRVSVTNLEPNTKYMFLLDIVPMDDNRYKYHESAWTISGKSEPHLYGRYYIHPDSPQTGTQWMKQYILFNKVKVTNNPVHNSNHIILNSMHRYIPRLHIVQASDNYSIRTGPLGTFVFNETAFIAVTAYQNDQITKLKINNNPFAKGFRENQHGKKTHSKPLKRLHSGLSTDKPIKFDEIHREHFKSEPSSLFSAAMHRVIADSTIPPYLDNSVGDHEHDSDGNVSPQKPDVPNWSSPHPYQYPSHPFYSQYPNDPSSMMYNANYAYISPSSGQFPSSPTTPMSLNTYGCYPPSIYYNNHYNPSFI